MKKIYFATIVLGSIFVSSCSKTENEFTTSFSTQSTNLVTSIETGESFATKSLYDFYFTTNNNQGTIGTNNLLINNTTYSFTSELTSFQTYFFQNTGEVDILKSPIGTVRSSGGNTYPLESSDAVFSTLNYWNPTLPGSSTSVNGQPAVVYQYNIGNLYNVKTFASDALYMGTSRTSYQGADGEVVYNNETMSYRVRMDIENKKADLIIYKARFAEAMPMELASIVVPGLKVEWLEGTYQVSGENIVPLVYENNNPVEYPSFIFNSVKVVPTNDELTEVYIDYEVAGRYNGAFSGAYLYDPFKK